MHKQSIRAVNNKILKSIFLITIFLFKLPSFTFIPSAGIFFLSQFWARVFIIFLLFYFSIFRRNMFSYFLTKLRKDPAFLLIVAIFLCQSISIINATNINAFLIRYKDIVIGIASFIVFYIFRTNKKEVLYIFVITTTISLLYQIIIFKWPLIYFNHLSNYIYDKQAYLTILNISRSRIFVESFDEAIIPMLFTNLINHWLSFVLLVGILLMSILSEWRTRIVMALFSLITSIYFMRLFKYPTKKKVGYSLIILILLFLGIKLVISNFSVGSRLSTDDPSNIQSITSRVKQIELGVEFGKTSVFGTGLGNFYDNLTYGKKYIYSALNIKEAKLGEIAQEYIHNNFILYYAESGIFSLIIFLVLILWFAFKDFKELIYIKNTYRKALILCFWTLFIHGFFNPPIAGSYQVLFWGIRGIITK